MPWKVNWPVDEADVLIAEEGGAAGAKTGISPASTTGRDLAVDLRLILRAWFTGDVGEKLLQGDLPRQRVLSGAAQAYNCAVQHFAQALLPHFGRKIIAATTAIEDAPLILL